MLMGGLRARKLYKLQLLNCASEIEPRVSICSLADTNNFPPLSAKLVELLQTLIRVACLGWIIDHLIPIHDISTAFRLTLTLPGNEEYQRNYKQRDREFASHFICSFADLIDHPGNHNEPHY